MNRIIENNQVTISGEIVSDFRYSHQLYGEGFYVVDVKVQRLSENFDTIPVTVSERLMDVSKDCAGMFVRVNGQFRSYNCHEERKNRLVLSVFAREVEFISEFPNDAEANQIYLEGYICKEPVYRKTPLGREIADVLLAVNRPYGKSDYIPCICWGRTANWAGSLKVGTRCQILGRIQSREYVKKLADETTETRVAYEVSVSKLEAVDNEEQGD